MGFLAFRWPFGSDFRSHLRKRRPNFVFEVVLQAIRLSWAKLGSQTSFSQRIQISHYVHISQLTHVLFAGIFAASLDSGLLSSYRKSRVFWGISWFLASWHRIVSSSSRSEQVRQTAFGTPTMPKHCKSPNSLGDPSWWSSMIQPTCPAKMRFDLLLARPQVDERVDSSSAGLTGHRSMVRSLRQDSRLHLCLMWRSVTENAESSGTNIPGRCGPVSGRQR